MSVSVRATKINGSLAMCYIHINNFSSTDKSHGNQGERLYPYRRLQEKDDSSKTMSNLVFTRVFREFKIIWDVSHGHGWPISSTFSNLFVQMAIEANKKRIPTLEFCTTDADPVFTTFFAYALLSESCSFVDGICGLISFTGVIIAARPDFIFGESHGHTSVMFNKGLAKKYKAETLYMMGVGYILLGAIFISLYYVLTRKISQKMTPKIYFLPEKSTPKMAHPLPEYMVVTPPPRTFLAN